MSQSDIEDTIVRDFEKARAILDSDKYNYQLKKFLPYRDLIQESGLALKKQSKQSRSRRSRARKILLAVYEASGFEAFVMCTIAATITTLGGLPSSASTNISKWWITFPRSEKLSRLAEELSTKYPIDNLTYVPPKDLPREVSSPDGHYLTGEAIETDQQKRQVRGAPPYRTVLNRDDLLDFLRMNTDYGSFILHTPENEAETPSIEISRQMCQDLIMHIVERMKGGPVNE